MMTTNKERVDYFRQKYGEPHYLFACMAAFTPLLTPDYLGTLWLNFNDYSTNGKSETPIQVMAVPDLLLSSLCQPVGYKIYSMAEETRLLLLSDLSEDLKNIISQFRSAYEQKRTFQGFGYIEATLQSRKPNN
jgi:hypothetical protein